MEANLAIWTRIISVCLPSTIYSTMSKMLTRLLKNISTTAYSFQKMPIFHPSIMWMTTTSQIPTRASPILPKKDAQIMFLLRESLASVRAYPRYQLVGNPDELLMVWMRTDTSRMTRGREPIQHRLFWQAR